MNEGVSNTFLIDRRRENVARLLAKGVSRTKIAEQLQVSVTTVARDIKFLHEGWLQNALRDFDAARAEEVAKLLNLEAEAWQAWERSCRDEETTKVITDGEKKRAERITKRQSGDIKFLESVARCIERRCRILGLEAPIGLSKSGHAPGDQSSPDDERDRALEIVCELRDRVRIASARGNIRDRTREPTAQQRRTRLLDMLDSIEQRADALDDCAIAEPDSGDEPDENASAG